MKYTNYLWIRWLPKAVPYGPATRETGEINHGFKAIKGDPEAAASIPELNDDDALRSLVVALNDSRTGLFTVGCVSGPVSDERGYRYSGYVEFAINSREGIEDAQHYFPLFFHFDKILQEERPHLPVQFDWELQPVELPQFEIGGFTCAITVNVHFMTSDAEALAHWNDSMIVLRDFLKEFPRQLGTPLYGP